jgi:hypothetical protein
MRTMLINQLRGLLFEFGLTFHKGACAGLHEIVERMAEIEQHPPGEIHQGPQAWPAPQGRI